MTLEQTRPQKLVLEDMSGSVLRTYPLSDIVTNQSSLKVIRRQDSGRIEVMTSTEDLENQDIEFQILNDFNKTDLAKAPILLGRMGHLRLIEDIQKTDKNIDLKDESDRRMVYILLAIFLLAFLLGGILISNRTPTQAMVDELKQDVVKIVKNMNVQKPVQKIQANQTKEQDVQPTTKTTRKENTLKRMGALSALGSLSNSKQKGGIDLGAVKTTAGPGLGGTEGSGGIQTSLYGKGLTAAPLGAGANLQGGGGYGTKGKGGGQAGYGKLSLTGSAGTNPIALTQEATMESGLDRDQIAAVVNRNMGQIRFCYEQGLQGDASLNGRVAVDFTISGSGQVSAAGIANTTLNSKMIEDCIVMRLKTWKFPLPQGGVNVKVTYPFNLKRAGQG
jgi:hypothetical protein